MSKQVKIKTEPGKWYVIDRFGLEIPIVSGPFDTAEEAEEDRKQLNIADDCEVRRVKIK